MHVHVHALKNKLKLPMFLQGAIKGRKEAILYTASWKCELVSKPRHCVHPWKVSNVNHQFIAFTLVFHFNIILAQCMHTVVNHPPAYHHSHARCSCAAGRPCEPHMQCTLESIAIWGGVPWFAEIVLALSGPTCKCIYGAWSGDMQWRQEQDNCRHNYYAAFPASLKSPAPQGSMSKLIHNIMVSDVPCMGVQALNVDPKMKRSKSQYYYYT